MRCSFENTGDKEWTCTQCGRVVRSSTGRINAACHPVEKPKPVQACIHFGEQVGYVVCQTCGGRGDQIPVFACAIHGTCSTRYISREVRICYECDDKLLCQSPENLVS